MRRNRPTVVVHADLSFLAGGDGGAELDVLGPLSREVARRLACDAKVLVSADGPGGQSLNLGRTRRDPSDAQRIEIRRRDKGCRFPGCTHTEFTDVHHVLHWTNGGATDLANLVELCDQHHRFVHEMGWKISGDANVELVPEPHRTADDLDPVARLQRSARRTAWLIASCRATFSARAGTRTRTTAGARSRGQGRLQLVSVVTSSTGRPKPARHRAQVARGRRPEEGLEHVGRAGPSPAAGTRRSPAAVVDHDEGARHASGRLTSPETSCRNARSPRSATCGARPRLGRGDTERRGDDAVDPVGAPVGQHPRRRRARLAANHSRSRIGMEADDDHGRVGRRGVAVQGPGHLRLAELGGRAPVDGRLRRSSMARHEASQSGSAGLAAVR